MLESLNPRIITDPFEFSAFVFETHERVARVAATPEEPFGYAVAAVWYHQALIVAVVGMSDTDHGSASKLILSPTTGSDPTSTIPSEMIEIANAERRSLVTIWAAPRHTLVWQRIPGINLQ